MTEGVLIRLPDVIGNLMQSFAAKNKMVKKLYSDHPEFIEHKPLVANIISRLEGNNMEATYEDIIAMATPEIIKAINIKKKVNMEYSGKPKKTKIIDPNGMI